MAAITNLSFEAGTGGAPAAWAVTATSSAERLYVFADGTAAESFESGWGADGSELAFQPSDLESASFTNPVTTLPITREAFEVGWATNELYSTTTFDAEAYVFSAAPEGQEWFETGWASPYLYAFVGVGTDLTSAGVDTFESGWFTGSYLTALGAATAHTWNGTRASAAETYEYQQSDLPCRISIVDGTINTGVGVPYAVGQTIQFYSTGLLPDGLMPDTPYLVQAIALGLFTVTLGGVTQIPTSPGVGVLYLTAPVEWWTALITI